mgnify:CR=1 FL=1
MKIQVKQFAKKKIEALVKKDMQEWPPGCAGWMYQPKRPYVLRSICKKNENNFNLRCMVAFLFQQQKALCHFSLLVTPISLRIFSILLQKCRQYCLLCIQCKKGWHNAQIERSYSNVAIY